KVDRKALPKPTLQQVQQVYIAPETATEEKLAGLWADVLGVEEPISREANFFEIGGQSLKAIQLLSLIRQQFSAELVVKDIFLTPVLADLATLINQADEQQQSPVIPTDRTGLMPLSHMQQRLWFIDQMEGSSTHYNMPLAFNWHGPINIKTLQQALLTLVARHEVLRTQFISQGGQAYQQVVPVPKYFPLPIHDLRDETESEQQIKLTALYAQADQPFNLSGDLMLRAQLIRLDDTQSILQLNLHHIAADGWSLDILMNELSQLYLAYEKGEANPLPTLAVQYGDYAQWQQTWLQGELLQAKIDYWQTQLAGIPQVHSLSLDKPRPVMQQYHGGLLETAIPHEVTAQLKGICQQQGATLFMGLHAAFAVLLSRFSGEQDIVVGTPIANREQAEVAELIGFFANTLVLRCDLRNAPTYQTLLGQCKDTALKAYEHQQVPFEQLVDILQPERSLSYHPLFQVMLSLAQTAPENQETEGLPITPIDLYKTGNVAAKFDLTLHAVEQAETISLGWEYCTDLFEASTIERMAASFNQLLISLLANPEQNVFSLPMLSATEQQRLLMDYNKTAAEYPKTASLPGLFEAQVARTPDATAVTFNNKSLTYATLNQQANQLAVILQAQGVGPDQLVGVYLERSIDMVVALLATVKAGGAYVPLDPNYPQDRIQYMLADSEPVVVLTSTALQATLSEILPVATNTLCLDAPEIKQQLSSQAFIENPVVADFTAQHLAYVIYTSGSTGKPKG
ncbi:condensation domain-containing protein, partial [Spartinivicinus poritis]